MAHNRRTSCKQIRQLHTTSAKNIPKLSKVKPNYFGAVFMVSAKKKEINVKTYQRYTIY